MEQVQKQENRQKRENDDTAEIEPKEERNRQLSDDIEDLLDEIDTVLEPEAEKFVNDYIQQGGE